MNLLRTLTALGWLLIATAVDAATCTVPTSPNCGTVQSALDQAAPGDTITVNPGVYHEKVVVTHGGSAGGGYVTLQSATMHGAVLEGTGVSGSDMILISSKSYVLISGFEIRNHLDVSDGSGIRIVGSGSHLEIRDNKIHDIRGRDAMGITVYGTAATPISNLIIDRNEIYDCEPARSEALTLNGNVDGFEVTRNLVRDVNNIGIDFIGGELDIQPDPTKVARNGVCRDNQVYRARSIYEGGYAGAIYVDGGRDILIERNITSESDLGLEIGAENGGTVTRNIIVRDNWIYQNDKAGLVFGGFDTSAGRVEQCQFLNNTIADNDTLNDGNGQLWIQHAEDNLVRNNIFVAADARMLASWQGNQDNQLDYNLWYASGAAPAFVWNGTEYLGLAALQAATAQESHGISLDPMFVDRSGGDLHLTAASPAVDAGDPTFVPGIGETDIDGATRVSAGRVDLGADEASCGDGSVDVGESCDDSNQNDCDGCDSNCTLSSTCGNDVRCGAEECDDGNSIGDCCDSACAFEATGSACDDGDLCSHDDSCDGGGSCVGEPTPAAGCKAPIAADRSSIHFLDRSPDERDQLKWKWSKGALTELAELGDPSANTRYALCLFDSSVRAQPLLRLNLPAGPTWSASRAGYRYKDRAAAADGVRSLAINAGEPGRAKISLTAKGLAVPAANLPWQLPVTVQLRNDQGECWGAVYDDAATSDSLQFKAKGD